jgi:hypothetical protein
LTAANKCCRVLPYSYNWDNWDTPGCGENPSRSEVETCEGQCSCSDRREKQIQFKAAECCAVSFKYVWGEWTSAACGVEKRRKEIERCEAASNCHCSNDRTVKEEKKTDCCKVDYEYVLIFLFSRLLVFITIVVFQDRVHVHEW